MVSLVACVALLIGFGHRGQHLRGLDFNLSVHTNVNDRDGSRSSLLSKREIRCIAIPCIFEDMGQTEPYHQVAFGKLKFETQRQVILVRQDKINTLSTFCSLPCRTFREQLPINRSFAQVLPDTALPGV